VDAVLPPPLCRYGFVDILVADALYFETPFVQALESLGLEWVINFKDNQPDWAAEAELLTNRPADCLVRVVKTVRVQNANRVAVRKQNGQPITEKQPAPIVSTNFYATNVDLGAIPPQFIHQLGRSRCVIDAQAFQTITTDCHLKQPSVHQSRALVVLTMARVLAYTLAMVFYFRQVRSHARTPPPSFCEMARQFGYAFLTLRFDSS
jgi:hypothetical protein